MTLNRDSENPLSLIEPYLLSFMKEGAVHLFHADANKRKIDQCMHDQEEIFFQISGKTLFQGGDQETELPAGQVMIVPPYTPHWEWALEKKEPFLNMVLTVERDRSHFHTAICSAGIPIIKKWISLQRDDRLFNLKTELLALNKAPKPVRQAAQKGIITAILYRLLSLKVETHVSGKVSHASRIIDLSLSDTDLSVHSLAEKIGCNGDYLSSLFCKERGISLIGEIHRRRIEKAKQLLKIPGMNSSEIAQACGFNNPSYFNRIFKRLTGMTPLSYRKR